MAYPWVFYIGRQTRRMAGYDCGYKVGVDCFDLGEVDD